MHRLAEFEREANVFLGASGFAFDAKHRVALLDQAAGDTASADGIGEVTVAQTVVVERSTDVALTGPLEAAGVTMVRA